MRCANITLCRWVFFFALCLILDTVSIAINYSIQKLKVTKYPNVLKNGSFPFVPPPPVRYAPPSDRARVIT